MAYLTTIPNASNNWSSDLSSMAENFILIRQFFMTGVIPIDGAVVTYSYSAEGNLSAASFSGSLAGLANFSYNAAGELTKEEWSVYGKTVTVIHTYSSGNLSTSSTTVA